MPEMETLESINQVLKVGQLEKRSENFLQIWKKKRAVLTGDGLTLVQPGSGGGGGGGGSSSDSGLDNGGCGKRLGFDLVRTVDCVERRGRYTYFTVVLSSGKELDFRCPAEAGWNAEIILAMVQFKNRRAVQEARARLAGGAGGDGGGGGGGGAGVVGGVRGARSNGSSPERSPSPRRGWPVRDGSLRLSLRREMKSAASCQLIQTYLADL
ncbi:unnamed protein product [Lampetra planeri]